MPLLCLVTEIAAPPDVCFDMSRDVDAHMESTAGSGERAVAGTTHGLMGLGDEVTWEARHLGVKQRLASRITAFDPPYRFVDEMVYGAFASMRHEHLFVPTTGGTLMVDLFEYRSPLGPLGRLADFLLLRRYMTWLLTDRGSFLRQQAEVATVARAAGGRGGRDVA